VWTLYRCKTCLYAWRSTEPEENTNPDKYPAAFRLSPDDVASFPIVPNIPGALARLGLAKQNRAKKWHVTVTLSDRFYRELAPHNVPGSVSVTT
jgi:hypothetical protein